jgi:hypothetical protein
VISSSGSSDIVFSTELLYLGLFSDTGCQFQIIYSFKNEIPIKPYGLNLGISPTIKK